MANIEVKDKDGELEVAVNDQALIRRYEKACSLDEKKIEERISGFLSRQ